MYTHMQEGQAQTPAQDILQHLHVAASFGMELCSTALQAPPATPPTPSSASACALASLAPARLPTSTVGPPPPATAHVTTALSSLQVATCPSALHATPVTAPSLDTCWPLFASQTTAVLSLDALPMSVLSGLHATLFTKSVCPSSREILLPVEEFQTTTVLSSLHVANCAPSLLNATPLTQSVWPCRVSSFLFSSSELHTIAVLSAEPDAILSPFHATLRTSPV